MSTETLKFFEDKSTEAIINWMLSHLTEDQIRMCLDQSGIPDTSVSPGAGPSSDTGPSIAAAAAGSGPIQTVTLPDGTQQQIEPTPKKTGGAIKMFTDKYRKMCNGTTYLIKSVTKEGVTYYQFKEVEDEDVAMNPGLSVGNINWVLKETPLSQFKTYCTDEDREILELLKEESPETFNTPPVEVQEIVADYINNGFPSPIPDMQITATVTEPIAPTPVETVVDITESIMKALKIQQESGSFIQQTYPLLYDNGMTMFPVFIYGSEGNNVLFMSAVVQDGKLVLVQDISNKALLNSKFKKVLKAIGDAMAAGLYIPSPGIPQQLNAELPEGDIKNKIAYIYTTAKQSGINFFGALEDDFEDLNVSMMSEPLLASQESFVDIPEMPDSGTPMEDVPVIMKKQSRKKKVSEMTQAELDERMVELFGTQFSMDHEAVKYTNALGVQNVKYVKKCECEKPCPSRDSSFEEIERPIFTEFQGKPSVNTGVGRFGELEDIEEDTEEDLLFS